MINLEYTDNQIAHIINKIIMEITLKIIIQMVNTVIIHSFIKIIKNKDKARIIEDIHELMDGRIKNIDKIL